MWPESMTDVYLYCAESDHIGLDYKLFMKGVHMHGIACGRDRICEEYL